MKTIILACGLALGTPLCAQTSREQANDSTLTRRQGGSTDEVTQDRMNKGLVTSALDALSGQAAGVQVGTGGADRMAMLSSVRVRGTTSLTGGNDPLVIIDGVSSDLATLSSIYPADIESFTILKNAAETAQYGSRGASGVIEVRTKRGHGREFRISYDGNIGFESAYKNLKMLRRSGYIATAEQRGLDYNDGGYDTDFPKAITQTGFVENHHVAFSGGSEESSYRASVGLMDHNTVVQTNGYRNFIAKFDLTQHAFDGLLTIDMGMFGSTQQASDLFDVQEVFYSAAAMNPTYSYNRHDAGNATTNSTASQINPPDALLNKKNDERGINFNTHVGMDFDLSSLLRQLASSLHVKLFGSYSYSSIENAQFCPTWVWAQGQAYRGEHKAADWLGNIQASYATTLGLAHHVEATLLGEYQKTRRTGFWTLVKGFTTNDFGYDNLGAASIRPYGGTGSDYADPRLASVMANVAYTLLDRYKLTLTARADGSSMVGENHRWGTFPSMSAEWDVTGEPWMQRLTTGAGGPLRWLSTLKLRTGYGWSGNLGGIDSYNSLQLVRQVGVVPDNGSPVVTMGIVRNANPDLRWETRATFNIGADIGLWNNRIVMTAEYYRSKTRDMLYQYDVPVPPYPYEKLLANIGSMRNSGLEIGLGATPIQGKDMELNINVNMAWQQNKLLTLSGYLGGEYMSANDITPIGGLNGAGFHGGDNNIVYQIVGQPLGVFYLPHCTGLVENADGSWSYAIEDLDGNGQVNIEDGGDRRICGQATPKMTLGSNISFRYKDFDISLQMNGAFGHKIYNGTSLTYMNMSSFPDYNVLAEAPGRNISDQTATDYWLERGDYLNFDYLTVGWNVPVRGKAIRSLRLSCSVNNLATITSYSGLTPMVNSYVVSNTLGIDDKRSYPPYRSYTLGINISF